MATNDSKKLAEVKAELTMYRSGEYPGPTVYVEDTGCRKLDEVLILREAASELIDYLGTFGENGMDPDQLEMTVHALQGVSDMLRVRQHGDVSEVAHG